MAKWMIQFRPNPDNGHSGPTTISPKEYDHRNAADSIAQGIDAGGEWWCSVITADEARRRVEAGEATWRIEAPSSWTNEEVTTLRQLRVEAAEAGDFAQVALCDKALQGDDAARAECARVIRAAQAMHD